MVINTKNIVNVYVLCYQTVSWWLVKIINALGDDFLVHLDNVHNEKKNY